MAPPRRVYPRDRAYFFVLLALLLLCPVRRRAAAQSQPADEAQLLLQIKSAWGNPPVLARCTTGHVLFAEGPGHSAKAQKPSAKALPSAALGKKINGKEALCRGPFVGHSAKPFPRANGGARQRKAAVNGAAPLTAPLPSADS